MTYCQKGKIYQMSFSRDLSLALHYSKILLISSMVEIRNKTIKIADDTRLE